MSQPPAFSRLYVQSNVSGIEAMIGEWQVPLLYRFDGLIVCNVCIFWALDSSPWRFCSVEWLFCNVVSLSEKAVMQ